MIPFEFLRHILVAEFNVPADRITPEATMDSLGLDSLCLAELVIEIESEYDIVIPEDQVKFSTLGGAATLIQDLLTRPT